MHGNHGLNVQYFTRASLGYVLGSLLIMGCSDSGNPGPTYEPPPPPPEPISTTISAPASVWAERWLLLTRHLGHGKVFGRQRGSSWQRSSLYSRLLQSNTFATTVAATVASSAISASCSTTIAPSTKATALRHWIQQQGQRVCVFVRQVAPVTASAFCGRAS